MQEPASQEQHSCWPIGLTAREQSDIKALFKLSPKVKAPLTLPATGGNAGNVGNWPLRRVLRPDDMPGTGPQCGTAQRG